MGMDVYMNWDGMTAKDRKAQMTGFSIDAGNKGYLRASYGMPNECSFLESFFEGYFEVTDAESKKGGKVFDFSDKNWQKLCRLGQFYLIAVMLGRKIRTPKTAEGEKMVNGIRDMLEKNFKPDDVQSASSLQLPDAVCWLNSMFEFFRLGYEKQREGKVRVEISY